MGKSVRLVPLGGLGEVGMNCLAIECRNAIYLIDCGIGFTGRHGAELMHPDFEWLLSRRRKVRAVLVTHGHEDHIGALPYLLREIDAPVYGPRHAIACAEARLAEHGVRPTLVEHAPGSAVDLGPIQVDRFWVHHSIPEATGLILHTPIGKLVHTGDFKIERPPSDGQRFDRERLHALAERGVRLLMSDSTNIDVNGRAGLERDAAAELARLVEQAPYRVVVSTFSSNVMRIGAALEAARASQRKVCLLGLSVRRHVEIATRLGMLAVPDALLVSSQKAAELPRANVMIVAGGTQGELGSSLRRLAADGHPHVHLEPQDTVLLSSRIIPGNEMAVVSMVDAFERRGVIVETRREHPSMHASGHGGRDEQREMLELLRPRAFIPIHGTYHHLRSHAALAAELGVEERLVIENGTVVEVTESTMSVVGSVPSGRVYVDGNITLSEGVLDERAKMGRGGAVTAWVTLHKGRLKKPPSIVSFGIFDDGASESEERRLAKHIRAELGGKRFKEPADASAIAEEAIRSFFSRAQRKYPLISVHVDDAG